MSETDTSARETLTHPPQRRSGPCVDRPRRAAPAGGEEANRLGHEAVLDLADAAVSASSSSPYITGPGSCRMAGPPSTTSSEKCTVTPVERTPQARACSIACRPGKAGSIDGMEVDDPVGEAVEEDPAEDAHPAREHHHVGPARGHHVGQLGVALAAGAAVERDHPRGDRGAPARARARAPPGARAHHQHDRDRAPGRVDRVDQALEVGPAAEHQHHHPQATLSHG